MAISPQNPDVIYATIAAQGTSGGFFRSADRGETWVKQSNWVSGDPQFYGEIFADPHHFDWVYGVAINMMLTRDGGKTFAQPPTRGVHVDYHHVGFDPADSTYLMLGNDGGLYDSYDNGLNWRHFRIPVTQFYRISVDNATPFYNVFGGAQDNGTQGTPSRSQFGGGIRESEVMRVAGGDGFQPRADPEDPNTIYALSQNGSLQRVDKRTGENKGIRAPRIMPDSSRVRWHWDVPLLVSPHSHTRLYILGSRLFRSDDRGDSWTAASPDLTRQLNRDTIPVMGRLWGQDAVNRNLFTSLANAVKQSAPMLFAPRLTPVYIETPLQGGGTGNGSYSGANPPFGALLSYCVPDAFQVGAALAQQGQSPTQTEVVLAVSDAAGAAIAQIPVAVTPGLHRAVWNLRKMVLPPPPPPVAGAQGGPGGPGGFGGFGGGRANTPLVAPGAYTVQLYTRGFRDARRAHRRVAATSGCAAALNASTRQGSCVTLGGAGRARAPRFPWQRA